MRSGEQEDALAAVERLSITLPAEMEAKARQTAERPRSFPARTDIGPGLRMAVHGRYMLLFRELDDEVRIVHGARDLQRIFDA